MWISNRDGKSDGKSDRDGNTVNREKARIRPEYPGPGAPIREKPGLVRGPLKGLLGKALISIPIYNLRCDPYRVIPVYGNVYDFIYNSTFIINYCQI